MTLNDYIRIAFAVTAWASVAYAVAVVKNPAASALARVAAFFWLILLVPAVLFLTFAALHGE